MKFGLFHSVQLPDPARQNEYYRDALEQVLWAEQLGYDSVWMTEHHFSRHGIVSASLSVLAYLAGLTSRIRLATAVTVLPFHNPIQIAEEAATVDLLSNGRLDLGVGRGYQWGEFHKFNIPMEEADRRFQEAIGVLTRAWTETEPFDHRGEFWTLRYDGAAQAGAVPLSAAVGGRRQPGQYGPHRRQRLEPAGGAGADL